MKIASASIVITHLPGRAPSRLAIRRRHWEHYPMLQHGEAKSKITFLGFSSGTIGRVYTLGVVHAIDTGFSGGGNFALWNDHAALAM
jgi:hypothetical protein